MIADNVEIWAQVYTGVSKDVSISSVFDYWSLKEFNLESYVNQFCGKLSYAKV